MTKDTTGIIVFILSIVFLVVAYFGWQKTPTPSPYIRWQYSTEYIDEVNPKTHVTVQVNGTEYDGGSYPGTCFDRSELEKSLHEISGIRCWWAGAGDDVGVFDESGIFTIRHRVLDEGDEGKGVVGSFTILLSLGGRNK